MRKRDGRISRSACGPRRRVMPARKAGLAACSFACVVIGVVAYVATVPMMMKAIDGEGAGPVTALLFGQPFAAADGSDAGGPGVLSESAAGGLLADVSSLVFGSDSSNAAVVATGGGTGTGASSSLFSGFTALTGSGSSSASSNAFTQAVAHAGSNASTSGGGTSSSTPSGSGSSQQGASGGSGSGSSASPEPSPEPDPGEWQEPAQPTIDQAKLAQYEQKLIDLYNALPGYVDEVNGITNDVNAYMYDPSLSTRQMKASACSSLTSRLMNQWSAAMNCIELDYMAPVDELHPGLQENLAVLYRCLSYYVGSLNDAWDESTAHADPAPYRDQIEGMIHKDDVNGQNQFLAQFSALYPQVHL